MPHRLALVLILSLSFASVAAAGLEDPAPLIEGQKVKVVYLISGITSSTDVGSLVHCTSLEKSSSHLVALQVFTSSGGAEVSDVVNGEGVVLAVAPGETVTFVVTGDGDGILGIPGFDAQIDGVAAQGSARVLSTTKKLICTALVVEADSNPPISMAPLSIFKKSQKGD